MTPTTEHELAEAIASSTGPLSIHGGGTRPIGKLVEGAPLNTTGLNGITLYEPGSLTLVVRSGTPVSKVEKTLASEGQRLAFEPMDHRVLLGTTGEPTMGGIAAANISGPRRIQVGAARDFLLGVRFVDGSGNIVKNGGRVMKNVTGYDLVKLLAGSYGTLGVLTEVSFKVLPIAERQLTLSIARQSAAEAVASISKAMSSPFEVTGAAHVGDTTHLRIEGTEASTTYRSERLASLLDGELQINEDQVAQTELWQDIKNVNQLASHSNVWRVSMTPSKAPDFIEMVKREHETEILMDWAGGLLWIGSQGEPKALHEKLQKEIYSYGGGHVTLVKASPESRSALSVFQPEPRAIGALTNGLRARFDPKGILNPGLMS